MLPKNSKKYGKAKNDDRYNKIILIIFNSPKKITNNNKRLIIKNILLVF